MLADSKKRKALAIRRNLREKALWGKDYGKLKVQTALRCLPGFRRRRWEPGRDLGNSRKGHRRRKLSPAGNKRSKIGLEEKREKI